MDKKITINGTDYPMKPGMRAIIAFETMTDKAFSITTTTDVLAYIYASIIAANPDTTLKWDDMLDVFDDDPELLKQATEVVLPRTAADTIVQLANEGGPEPKKD